MFIIKIKIKICSVIENVLILSIYVDSVDNKLTHIPIKSNFSKRL